MAIIFQPDPERQQQLLDRSRGALIEEIMDPYRDRDQDEQRNIERQLRDYLADQAAGR